MQVGLIGAGNMARALARGWGDPVLCSDSGSGRAAELVAELGGRAASNVEVAQAADLVILCHKPAQISAVARQIAGSVKAVVSVLGSVTTEALAAVYPGVPLLRLMPNTPVEVRQGVVCYCAPREAEPELEREVVELFGRLGTVVRVDEWLVVETMTGSAALLRARGYDTLTVRPEVTSPGGSTARGLDALERAGLRAAFSAATDGVCEVAR